uniref:RRP15-like protein n=1 Tax=Elaeis guineensis var. tenera TaxID=51953 RepID=A0A6I9RXA7_ELAGV|nr:RRP15-like protein [Elaeis guineensis]
MPAQVESPEATTAIAPHKKRKPKHKKGKTPNKKIKKAAGAMAAAAKHNNPSKKMIKLFRKRAREYNSEDDDDDDYDEEKSTAGLRDSSAEALQDREDVASSGDSGEEGEGQRALDSGDDFSGDSEGDDEDEGYGAHQRITKFAEGSRAFRVAFMKIMKKNLPNDPLGPILSAHKKLVAEKLAEEETEHKVKGEAKKEKHLAAEKGRVKPANFLDAKEKSLISIATKGVVKLFNAVSKAQNPQRGLNPSKSKDAKVLAKQRKQTFLSELQKPTTQAPGNPSPFNSSKVPNSTGKEHSNEPGWAPLRDSYMLSSKLKDWDKMPDPGGAVDEEDVSLESSSDEE